MHASPLARLAATRPFLRSCGSAIAIDHRRNDSMLSSNLKARRLPLIYDYLSPVPSHLLNLSLADFLPPPPPHSQGSTSPLELPSIDPPQHMPQGYHLVYFPPQIPESLLLPDGTDPLQSPGPPWVCRLWAGGSVKWNPDQTRVLQLLGQRAVCVESITDVVVKAKGDAEKVFVTIERRMGAVEEGMVEEEVRRQLSGGEAAVVEKRIIAFMRERTAEQAAAAAGTPGKVVKPPRSPTFTHTLRPSAALLFRFSALTFNAHKIHLDTAFCRSVEGHRNLLVHGPLQLILMLQLLARKAPGLCDVAEATISEIEYRNLSPLYAGEPLKLCGRPTDAEGVYDLWAETPAGGYAVKATARVSGGLSSGYR